MLRCHRGQFRQTENGQRLDRSCRRRNRRDLPRLVDAAGLRAVITDNEIAIPAFPKTLIALFAHFSMPEEWRPLFLSLAKKGGVGVNPRSHASLRANTPMQGGT
jgi:hypothetical protein